MDFSCIQTEEDVWHNPLQRETVRGVAERCEVFLDVLRETPHTHILVVSHGVFLEELVSRCSLVVADIDMQRRFENCEFRTLVIGGWRDVPRALATTQPKEPEASKITAVGRSRPTGGSAS